MSLFNFHAISKQVGEKMRYGEKGQMSIKPA